MPEFLHRYGTRFHFNEFNELFISRSIRGFARAMVGIFIPIFLLEIGYELWHVALFFVFTTGSRVVWNLFSGYLVSRFGPKHTMAFSYLIDGINMMNFYLLPSNPELLYIIAPLWGLSASTFWVAMHVDLSYAKSNKKATSQISKIYMLVKFGTALAPLAGGFLAGSFGLEAAFIGAIVFLLIALFPLYATPESFKDHRFSLAKMRELRIRKDVTSNVVMNMDSQVSVYLWAIFIYLILGTYEKIGIVISLSLIVAIVASYFIGKRGDKGHNKEQLKLGAVSNSFVHLLRPFAESASLVTGVNVLRDVSSLFLKIPYTTTYYEHADGHSRLEYVVKMEILGNSGMVAIWILAGILSLTFTMSQTIIIAFFVAAIASVFVPVIATNEPVQPY